MTFGEIIHSDQITIILFEDSYGCCDLAKTIIRDINSEFVGKIRTIDINADKNGELCEALRLKTFPTVMIYKSGQMLYRKAGEVVERELREKITEILKNP